MLARADLQVRMSRCALRWASHRSVGVDCACWPWMEVE